MTADIHRTPAQRCPNCERTLDAHMSSDLSEERAPEPGDTTVCAYCLIAMTYCDDLSLRVLKRAEVKRMPLDERRGIERAQRHARHFRALRRSPR